MSWTLMLNGNLSFPCAGDSPPPDVEHLLEDHVLQQEQDILTGIPLGIVVKLIPPGPTSSYQGNVRSKVLFLHRHRAETALM